MTKAEHYMLRFGYCFPFASKHSCVRSKPENCKECPIKDWFEHHFNFEEYE